MKSERMKNLPHSAIKLAQKLLKKKTDDIESLRLHDFPDDESAHDDELTERLYGEFSADFQSVQAELSKAYGPPSKKGKTDTAEIPYNGVFRYALWRVDGRKLFVVANHEDRGIPIILWLGTASE